MNKELSKPYETIKKILPSLAKLDEVPLLGNFPPFPLVDFSQKISNSLNIQDLKITFSEWDWRDSEKLFAGIGGDQQSLKFSLAPFEGEFFFAISMQDLEDIMNVLLLKEGALPKLIETEYLQAFYEFLAIEAIRTFESLEFSSEISPKLVQSGDLPKMPMLCLDISLFLQGKMKIGRLFFSKELQKSLAAHSLRKNQKSLFSSPLADKTEVILHLEAGSLTLSQAEWSTVKPGDFLFPDRCAFKPGQHDGEILITLKGYPFFKAQIQKEKIKILGS